jgi:hypothetical protein
MMTICVNKTRFECAKDQTHSENILSVLRNKMNQDKYREYALQCHLLRQAISYFGMLSYKQVFIESYEYDIGCTMNFHTLINISIQ